MIQKDKRLIRAAAQALHAGQRALLAGKALRAGLLAALTSGVAFGAAPAAGPAAAEGPAPAAPEAVEEIVVTGIRAAISNAVQMKENSNDIIEAISAEDLGKLPDLSIADSLARLPGLAAQRTDGRSDYISIRGFGPDFSGTTLGGREQASSGENRGVEFDQYPAELISAVEVYKTPDASLIGQGLAGTVNLETVKPLSFNHLTVALNARGEHNSNGDLNPGQGIGSYGSRVSLSVIDQFLDHTLGVAFGIARLDSPIQEKQYQAWYWGQNNGPPGSTAYNQPPNNQPAVPGDPNLAVSDEGMQLRAKSEGSVRTGVMGVVEWAPNEAYHSQLDLFFSDFDEPTYLNGVQWSSSAFGDNISYQNAQLTSEGSYNVLTGGTLNGVRPIQQNEFTDTGTRSYSIGWNNRLNVGGWTYTGDLSYSTAHVSVHDAYAFAGPNNVRLYGINFNIPSGGGYPTFTLPAGVNLADPSQVGFTDPDDYSYDGRVEFDHQSDTIRAVRLDVVHPLGWIFKNVDLGFDYSERRKVKTAFVDFAYLNGNGCSTSLMAGCAPYNSTMYTPINPGLLYSPTSLSYGGIPGIVDYNVLGAIASQDYLVQDMGTNDYNRNYTVDEKVPLGYVKFDIDTHLAGIPIRGNTGVQFVHTDQSSTSLITDASGQPSGTVTGGLTYNEWLPSLNLVGDLGNRNILRLGAAKEMQRPRIDDEKAAQSASVDPTTHMWSGSGGNPELKPYIAYSEDISYEKIFGKASYFSVALFNKNLTSYVFQQTQPTYNFAGYRTSTGAVTNFGMFTLPENGSGAKIQGYEITLVLEGNLFARWLDGFGLQSNFAYTDNEIPAAKLSLVEGGPPTFPGLSKKVAAATLYYEKYGVSIRVAETYRSDFTGEVTSNFDQIGYTLIAGETTTNFQAGYAFSTGKLNGVTLMLEINNLTNSAYHTLSLSTLNNVPNVETPLEYDTFGRTYLLGFNYKL